MSDQEPQESIPLVAIIATVGALVATLGFVGYHTFTSVSTSGYVVSVTAPNRNAVRVPAPSHSRAPEPRRVAFVAPAPSHEPATSPTPRATATPSASPSTSPSPVASPTTKPSAAPTKTTALRKKPVPKASRVASERTIAEAKARPHARRATDAASGNGPAISAVAASTVSQIAQAPTTIATVQPPPAPTATAVEVALAPAPPVYAPEKIVEARVKYAVQPEYPSDSSLVGTNATSVVLVTIGPTGRVIRTAMERSSGYGPFDRAAVNAARATEYYAPKIDGHPATESYRMVYEFK